MLLSINLFGLILAIPATFLFAYVSSSGLSLLLAAARSIPRPRLVQGCLVIALLFGTYAACFTPAPSRSLNLLTNLLHALPWSSPLPALIPTHDAPTVEHPHSWFRLPLPLVVRATTGISHAMCLFIGLLVVRWVTALVDNMKSRGIEEYQYRYVGAVFEMIFQAKFFLGVFFWYRYFLMPVSSVVGTEILGGRHSKDAPVSSDAEPAGIDHLTASILGLSHTLAFSIGFVLFHDYRARGLSKRSEVDVMRYYLSLAGVLIAARLAFQAICDATGLDPTSHDLLLLSAAISSFMLLNNKAESLMNYFWLPLAAGILSVVPALDSNPLVAFLMPYVHHNRELLALSVVGAGGFLLGVRFALRRLLASLSASTPSPSPNQAHFHHDPASPAASRSLTVADVAHQRRRAGRFPPPFPNGWYRLVTSDEVKAGQVKGVTALGRMFGVFRGETDGVVGVVDALCPHLGANLTVGGRVVGDRVECPFHGWQFDRTGKCGSIPYASSVPASARTRAWPTREVAGHVLIYFDAEGREPLHEPRPFPLADKPRYHVASRTATLPMHIQDFAENAADWMHFGKVHARVSLPVLDRFLYVKHRSAWSPSTGDDGPMDVHNPPFVCDLNAKAGEGGKYLPPPPMEQLDGEGCQHFSFYDVPSLHSVFSDAPLPSGDVHARVEFTGQGGLVYFRFATTFGEVTAVKTFLPLGGGGVGSGGLMLHMRDEVWAERGVPWLLARHIWNEAAKAFDDDIDLWCNKTYLPSPMLVKEDRPVKKFRDFYKKNYSPNSRTFAFENDEW